MAKTSKYIVPASEQREFDRMVQRANRRIQANFKFMQQEGIETEQAQRSLVGDYADRGEWHTAKTVFSRSKVFSSEKAYRAFKRHVAQWGDEKPSRSADAVKKGYEKAIIKALTTAAIDNNVPLVNGRLPGNVRAKIRNLTLEQMTHFFENSDPIDDLEYLPYSEIDFTGVDTEGYVDNVDTIINSLRQVYPHANQRAFNSLTAAGTDPREALQKIFPKATPRQISYYMRNGIPETYKAPRKKSKKKKTSRKKKK